MELRYIPSPIIAAYRAGKSSDTILAAALSLDLVGFT